MESNEIHPRVRDNSDGLILSDVTIGYRTSTLGSRWKYILSNISFEVPQSTVAVLLGDNAAGKTTLIKAAIGLIYPLSGKITLDGFKPRKCKIAYLPQTSGILSWRRAIDDAETLLEVAHVPRIKRREIATKSLERLEFDADLRKRNHQLSGGQKQKVAIARCLNAAGHVSLMAIDEPTNFLDQKSRQSFIEDFPMLLKGIKCPVLVATHDRELADTLEGIKLYIESGKIRKG